MMSEQKVTNYSVPVIFEPPCICILLHLFGFLLTVGSVLVYKLAEFFHFCLLLVTTIATTTAAAVEGDCCE